MEKTREDNISTKSLTESYANDQIGHCMTANCIVFPENNTNRDIMRSVLRQAVENEDIDILFVTGADGMYSGAVSLDSLIDAVTKHTPLEQVINRDYPSVNASDRIPDAIHQLKQHPVDFVPVLNAERVPIGTVTTANVIKIMREELQYDYEKLKGLDDDNDKKQMLSESVDNRRPWLELIEDVHRDLTDDYAKLAGLTSDENPNETVFMGVRTRIPWLILLLGLGMVVSGVVNQFEAIVAQLTVVVCFQSLITDMAGNVGTQSLAVTIRALMDEGMSGRKIWRFVIKEVLIGASNGLILGVLSFVFVGLYLHFANAISLQISFMVSGCVGTALIASMVLASLVGVVVPFFFNRIHIDPAAASGPLITTVDDLVAVVTYFGLAGLLLSKIPMV